MKGLPFDICIRCGQRKPISEMKKDSRVKRGYSKICKTCTAKYSREWYLKSGITGSKKWKSPREGFSHDDYLQMLDEQNGCCAICGKEEVVDSKLNKIRRLCIDHCHKTGLIRGLLCMKCNAGLGMFEDDINLLLDSIQYLKGN